MASRGLDKKCIKYTKKIASNSDKHIQCCRCSFFLHPRCSGLRHTDYVNKNKNYVCQCCTEYTCLRCNRHVYDKQDGIYCDGCNFCVHRTCANLSRKEYENLQKYGSDETWYCRPCIKNIFPFCDLSDNQISNIFQTKKKKRTGKMKMLKLTPNVKSQKTVVCVIKEIVKLINLSFVIIAIPQYTGSVAN